MILPAKSIDAPVLTDISFASKRYWNYPEQFYHIWRDELTITTDYILDNEVWLYRTAGNEDERSEGNEETVAYYSLVLLDKDLQVGGLSLALGYWLDHMFISPSHIGKGIGRKLFHHLTNLCLAKKIYTLNILADPKAKGFYERMGCQYLQEYPSTISGRTTPYLLFHAGEFS